MLLWSFAKSKTPTSPQSSVTIAHQAQRLLCYCSHPFAFLFSSKSVGLRREFQRFPTHLCLSRFHWARRATIQTSKGSAPVKFALRTNFYVASVQCHNSPPSSTLAVLLLTSFCLFILV